MNRVKGLLLMDVDSTLICEEGINLLGKKAGVGQEVAAITEAAMRGELDFEAALRERVSLLEGLPVSIFDEIRQDIHFTAGAHELVSELQARSYKIGVVSGGFHETVDSLVAELGIDYVKANRLEKKDGFLTGRLLGEIVTKEVKKAMLEKWARENGLDMSATVAVGDGANDLLMIKAAGLGIAFNAKPLVREQAPYRIDVPDLTQVLEILDRID
ncbi:phosphoserine phosphatase SerB [Streptococcus massiliensis]|uniref:phosphoserine phosphatase n=1 Tax=Streptococcus massiliensis TaxID=313439 RepID=A0A380KXF7_9STRE|nr:phosphoserine phosphatase SerB [Streptococcus massiliensis]SUN76241.1 phosphoserine phosphatase [Streptococcus massiliensis]